MILVNTFFPFSMSTKLHNAFPIGNLNLSANMSDIKYDIELTMIFCENKTQVMFCFHYD